MKLLKKFPVAILCTILIIAASVWLGQTRAPMAMPSGQGALQSLDTTIDTAQGRNWILDTAHVFTSDEINQMSLYNVNWNKQYRSKVGVVTVPTVGSQSMKDTALQYVDRLRITKQDALLLLSIEDKNAFLLKGNNLFFNWNDRDISDFLTQNLYEEFMSGNYGKGVLLTFSALNTEFADTHHVGETAASWSFLALFGVLLGNLFWIIPLLIILNIWDNIRYNNYAARCVASPYPPIPFRPILFWHGPGSRWYLRRQKRSPHAPNGPYKPNDPGCFHSRPQNRHHSSPYHHGPRGGGFGGFGGLGTFFGLGWLSGFGSGFGHHNNGFDRDFQEGSFDRDFDGGGFNSDIGSGFDSDFGGGFDSDFGGGFDGGGFGD